MLTSNPEQKTASGALRFVERFAAAFGRRQALLLKLAGFDAGEQSGNGCFVTDTAGRSWIDFGSYGVHLLGHRHPDVVASVRQMLDQMGLSTKILANEAVVQCGERLLELAGGRLNGVVFGNSGTESTEAAIRMAAIATDRSGFAAIKGGYHGKTLGAAALTDTIYRAPVAEHALSVVHLPLDDALAATAALSAARPAALFVELVQGEGGIQPLDADYLRAIAAACRDAGTLLVFDEIQTGLGRTGLPLETHRLGIEPDILLLGKILGGGLVPASAALFDRRAIGERASDPVLHSSTFAGGSLAAAAANAVLDIVSSASFLRDVDRLGAEASTRLQRMAGLPGVAQVRGRGLMLGVEFTDSSLCGEVVIEAAKRRLLVTFCLNETRVLRIFPPAVASLDELNMAFDLLEASILSAYQLWAHGDA
jgi:acetylornithine/N-succinyldiaminopimelate aminotransferase